MLIRFLISNVASPRAGNWNRHTTSWTRWPSRHNILNKSVQYYFMINWLLSILKLSNVFLWQFVIFVVESTKCGWSFDCSLSPSLRFAMRHLLISPLLSKTEEIVTELILSLSINTEEEKISTRTIKLQHWRCHSQRQVPRKLFSWMLFLPPSL